MRPDTPDLDHVVLRTGLRVHKSALNPRPLAFDKGDGIQIRLLDPMMDLRLTERPSMDEWRNLEDRPTPATHSILIH